MSIHQSSPIKDLSQITTYQSGIAQSTAYRRLNQHFSKILIKHELTVMQWFVLGTIYDAGQTGVRVTDLAEKVDTGMPFLTNMINLLESKKLVERVIHQGDARAKLVLVTSRFQDQCPKIEADLRHELRNSLYATITPEELRTYISVLYKLSALE
jgi:DNA-binding MarR family transcriptional regulator